MALFRTNNESDSSDSVRIKAQGATVGQFANLPSAFKDIPRGFKKEQLLDKIEGLGRWGLRQLQEAASALSSLNRYHMKADKRVEIVRSIIGLIYPTMARHYEIYQGKIMSLPESDERRNVLLASIEIADQAALAYKHLFKEIYSPKAQTHKRHRERVVEAGFRILEFIRIEQRFRALRHQKLPPGQWQDLNRTFFSLLLHKEENERLKLLGSIGTWIKVNKKETNEKLQTPLRSIKHIYLSTQLFGLLDAPSWSMRLIHTPDAYLDVVENALRIFPDSGENLEPGWLLTHIDQKGPPLFQREPHLPEPRIYIEYSNLYNRLVADYEELAKMKFIGRFDADKLSRPLLDLESMERFPLLETMLFGLRPRERKQKRRAAFGHETLRLYFGFRDSYKLLTDLTAPDVKRIIESRVFADMLASHSASTTDEATVSNRTRWEIVNFSTGGLLVLTRESAYANPIQIGQIVAFIPKEELKRPLLGYVSRISRPSDQQVEVAIVRLSNHAEAAVIHEDDQTTGRTGKAVLIFQSLDGRWCLVARHAYDLVSGTPMRLVREDGRQLPARLGNVMLTKQEFVIFELSAPGM